MRPRSIPCYILPNGNTPCCSIPEGSIATGILPTTNTPLASPPEGSKSREITDCICHRVFSIGQRENYAVLSWPFDLSLLTEALMGGGRGGGRGEDTQRDGAGGP